MKERVSEMISEKESYEEIVTDGIYNETTIADQIHTKWAGKTVHFARETDSTNLWIKRLAKEGASEGTLALAEFQSAGRGRLGRSWEVPEGTSVMMSILLRPKFEPQYAPTLTLVMGMAVAKAVKSLGFDVSIKWPNDVVVSHKKICGILTEMGVRDGKIDYAVIGVGINVNIKEFPEEMADKATSLYLESGKEFDRSQIPGLVMEAFEEYYEKFAATCDLSGLKEEYESILANYNQPVRVLAKEPYEGVARGITDGGELLVEKTDGTIATVSAGEVSVRGLYSYV
jgi:BirA family biotin operon repressor/biotin-[acetyl-CoA-carboxylase] ligase